MSEIEDHYHAEGGCEADEGYGCMGHPPSSQCSAFNEPAGGTCIVRCAKEAGHEGRHDGAYRITSDGVTLSRVWTDDSPQHRERDMAREWVDA